MNSVFRKLISERDFEKQAGHFFASLENTNTDYLYVFSLDRDNPCLMIDFDNCRQLSRITMSKSGQCDIEVVSFKDSAQLIHESYELRSLGEFEDKLLSLIAYMKASETLH